MNGAQVEGRHPQLERGRIIGLTERWRTLGLPLLVYRLLGQGAEFAAFVVLARRLGPDVFGQLAVAFLICRYAGMVADWGASIGGARDVAAQCSAESVQALVQRRYLVTAVLSAVYVAVTLAFGLLFLSPLVLTIAGRGLNRDWRALGQERGARAAIPALVQGTVMLAGSLLVTQGAAAALPIAAGYALAAAVSLLLNPLPVTQPREGVRMRVAAWVLIIVLADQVTASTDTVLLAALRSAREAGIYAAVYRIPNAWLTVVGLLVLSMIPVAARNLRDQPEQLVALRDRAVRRGTIWGGVVVLSILPAYLLVPLIFGESYSAGQIPLTILLLATAVNTAAAPLHPLYFALARDRTLALILVGVAVSNFAGNLLVIPRWGLTGAAATTLVAQILLLVLIRSSVTRAAATANLHLSH